MINKTTSQLKDYNDGTCQDCNLQAKLDIAVKALEKIKIHETQSETSNIEMYFEQWVYELREFSNKALQQIKEIK